VYIYTILFLSTPQIQLSTLSLLKKLAGETALYGLSSILGRVLTFAFLTPFLTRIFADQQDQVGIQSDLYAWTAFLLILFTYRMETAFFRFGNEKEVRPTAYKTAKYAVGCSTVVFVSLLVLFCQPIAAWLGYPQHAIYVVWFAFILGFDALAAIPFALLRLEGKALRFASIKLINLFVHLGFVLLFLGILPNYLPAYYNPEMGIGYVFVANLIASTVTFLLLLPTYFYKSTMEEEEEEKNPTPIVATFDKKLLQTMLIYALPLVLAGFAGIINEVLDRILLKRLLEGDMQYRLSQLGIYGSCYKIAIFMNLFTQAFNYAAEPFFFRNAKEKYARPLYAQVAFLFAIVGCFGFLGIMLYMDIAQYFVAYSYREGLIIVPILLVANLCLGLYYNVAIWFKLSNQTKYGAYIAVMGATITIVANIILIPLMPSFGYPGYLGSAWATLFCYASMVVAAYLLGQKHYPIPYPVFRIMAYVATVVVIYLIYGYLIKPHLVEHSILSYVVSTATLLLFASGVWWVDGQRIKAIIQHNPEG